MVWRKNKTGKIIFLAIFALLLIFAVWAIIILNRTAQVPLLKTTVQINSSLINVDIAATPAQQFEGLSGRTSLCPDCGMLFQFTDAEPREFVMREMNFPLDIIFLRSGDIIKIAENLPPDNQTPLKIYESGLPSDQVLELNAGYCASHQIKLGDKLLIP